MTIKEVRSWIYIRSRQGVEGRGGTTLAVGIRVHPLH